MAKPPREMLSVLLGSGDGRVVPTNQSARGDRHGSHRGSAFGSNSQGLHEPARRFEPLLPHEPRWVEEQVQSPQGPPSKPKNVPCLGFPPLGDMVGHARSYHTCQLSHGGKLTRPQPRSGSEETLLSPRPLRTVRETCASYGSSLR